MDTVSTDLNLYRVLYTIHLTRNLTKAGKILGVSQPAISNSLARLRKVYDDPLFVRRGSRMQPTSKTEMIIPQIQIALDLLTSTMGASEQPAFGKPQ